MPDVLNLQVVAEVGVNPHNEFFVAEENCVEQFDLYFSLDAEKDIAKLQFEPFDARLLLFGKALNF
jgi:hypothetical protein